MPCSGGRWPGTSRPTPVDESGKPTARRPPKPGGRRRGPIFMFASSTRSCGRWGRPVGSDGRQVELQRALRTGSARPLCGRAPAPWRSARPEATRLRAPGAVPGTASVSSSIGKKPIVARIRGPCSPSRSVRGGSCRRPPDHRTRRTCPTTPCFAQHLVRRSAPGRSPWSPPEAARRGESRLPSARACRSAGRASLPRLRCPPTPQPTTPRPLIIVVWQSVPTRLSGKATPSPVGTHLGQVFEIYLVADAGRGGDNSKVVESLLPPAEELIALAVPLEFFLDILPSEYSGAEEIDLDRVVDDELGRDRGLTRSGSPPRTSIASRIAARSTTAGTPVKSCIRMRVGRTPPRGSAPRMDPMSRALRCRPR